MFKVKRRATALLLAALMATSGPGVVGLAADFSANGSAKDSAVWQVGDTQVKGLKQKNPLQWTVLVHCRGFFASSCP